MSSQVRLSLLPFTRCMFDEPLQIRVTGLNSQQDVVLRARATDERGTNFTSWAEFRADHSGQVDVWRDAPLCGSYSGVQPMGLFWSMTPEIKHKNFFKVQALSPQVVHFSVHDKQDEQVLAQATNERSILGNGVQRETVTDQGFIGVLFTPPGSGLFPAVLDISTFPSEKRAGLLASRGFVVMTVWVMIHRKAPTPRLQLDGYEAAVQFLLQHHKVGSAEVGVVARSKGGDVALSLASFVRGVGAVVWINGCNANIGLPLFYKQLQILPVLQHHFSEHIPVTSSEHQDTVIPIEKASAQFLFVASEDDLYWDSLAFMEQLVQRMKSNGRENYETISYPGAGHLLEPPFSPFIASYHQDTEKRVMLWGGEAEAHANAEVHLWKKIQEFLRKHLYLKSEATKASSRL